MTRYARRLTATFAGPATVVVMRPVAARRRPGVPARAARGDRSFEASAKDIPRANGNVTACVRDWIDVAARDDARVKGRQTASTGRRPRRALPRHRHRPVLPTQAGGL